MGRLRSRLTGSWLSWLVRVALAGGVMILLSYVPYRFVARHDESKLVEMRGELHRVEREISKHETDLAVRRLKVDALKNDTGTIEDIARQELQMLYPHEKALRLKRARRE